MQEEDTTRKPMIRWEAIFNSSTSGFKHPTLAVQAKEEETCRRNVRKFTIKRVRTSVQDASETFRKEVDS
jgi:hypothetical protein